MGEEVADAIVPGSFLKKRKRSWEWGLAKEQTMKARKRERAANKKVIFKRAEQYAKEYNEQERDILKREIKLEAKLKGGAY